MIISRRNFLTRVGQAGGYSGAVSAMQSLGLMPMKGALAEPIAATAGSGKGVKVVVLGAGIGGLVTAYELKKLGYEVTLLEAQARPGGRNWTGRNGTKIKFVDGTTQTINWEEGNYQNLGPARLPSTHWTMLGYCRELQGALDAEISKEDRERMKDFLKYYGPLNAEGAYVGSDRAGWKVAPGAGNQV